jgi:hypothetical protein
MLSPKDTVGNGSCVEGDCALWVLDLIGRDKIAAIWGRRCWGDIGRKPENGTQLITVDEYETI